MFNFQEVYTEEAPDGGENYTASMDIFSKLNGLIE